jgi:ceramide glucosyltransferase
MDVVIGYVALKFAVFAMVVHLATVLIALRRLRTPDDRGGDFGNGPPVSIIRPVRGLDACEERTLRSTFELDYPGYEILFCCAEADDAAVPVLRKLIGEHPHVPARLLIGDDRISENPKLNNVMKGWRAAGYDWIVMADSNVDMPRDYLQRLLAAWRPDTGLVSAPPIGSAPQGAGGDLECAFLNTYQARWQYVADTLGAGFAQGKNLLWRRRDLDAAGGPQALAGEPAEDAAATKVVRGLGLRVRLADGAFPQPLPFKTMAQVWSRQVRWARLRRATFPYLFALEIASGIVAPLLAIAIAGTVLDLDTMPVAIAYAAVWFGAEAALAAGVGWHLTWRSALMWPVRELMLPALWVQAWFGNSFSWQGKAMTAERSLGTRASMVAAITLAGVSAGSDV